MIQYIDSYAAPFILLDSTQLANVKQMIVDGNASPRTMMAYKELLQEADRLLGIKNPTVIDKTIAPPTGDKHDYLSIGRYWWPDPNKSDGLPWIRKDGTTNPDTQTEAVDRKRLGLMIESSRVLSLAFYFSGKDVYARKAVSILKTWFIDEATRMNPHMEFGQSIPGYSEGRPYGMLDARAITFVVPDAISLLEDSQFWNSDLNSKMNSWFSAYLSWLTESDLGRQGFELENNHGSWYLVQVASLALYLENAMLVKEVVERAQTSLDHQLDKYGGQTHELARTKSFFYSCFNLEALTHIATIGSKVGLDMWNYKSKENKSLSLAIDYLAPGIQGKPWQHPSQNGPDISRLVPLLDKMSVHTKSEEYTILLREAISILNAEEKDTGQQNRTLQEMSLLSITDL